MTEQEEVSTRSVVEAPTAAAECRAAVFQGNHLFDCAAPRCFFLLGKSHTAHTGSRNHFGSQTVWLMGVTSLHVCKNQIIDTV